MIHELKTIQPFFSQVYSGIKNFELRINDRDFKIGDELILKEYCGGEFTGRVLYRRIDLVLENVPEFGLMKGFCILSISKI